MPIRTFLESLRQRINSLTSRDAAVASQLGLRPLSDAILRFTAGIGSQQDVSKLIDSLLVQQGPAPQGPAPTPPSGQGGTLPPPPEGFDLVGFQDWVNRFQSEGRLPPTILPWLKWLVGGGQGSPPGDLSQAPWVGAAVGPDPWTWLVQTRRQSGDPQFPVEPVSVEPTALPPSTPPSEEGLTVGTGIDFARLYLDTLIEANASNLARRQLGLGLLEFLQSVMSDPFNIVSATQLYGDVPGGGGTLAPVVAGQPGISSPAGALGPNMQQLFDELFGFVTSTSQGAGPPLPFPPGLAPPPIGVPPASAPTVPGLPELPTSGLAPVITPLPGGGFGGRAELPPMTTLGVAARGVPSTSGRQVSVRPRRSRKSKSNTRLAERIGGNAT